MAPEDAEIWFEAGKAWLGRRYILGSFRFIDFQRMPPDHTWDPKKLVEILSAAHIAYASSQVSVSLASLGESEGMERVS